MKKKVLNGWVTVTKEGGRLVTYPDFGFYVFQCRREAKYVILGTEKVVKVKVTIEPARTQGGKRQKI